jgi:hypothetical protein
MRFGASDAVYKITLRANFMLASLDAGEGRSAARANRVGVMYTIAGTTGLACCPGAWLTALYCF